MQAIYASLDSVKLVVVSAEKSKIDASKLHGSKVSVEVEWNGDIRIVNKSGKNLSEVMVVFVEYDDENNKVVGSIKSTTMSLRANTGTIIPAGKISEKAKMYVAYAKE